MDVDFILWLLYGSKHHQLPTGWNRWMNVALISNIMLLYTPFSGHFLFCKPTKSLFVDLSPQKITPKSKLGTGPSTCEIRNFSSTWGCWDSMKNRGNRPQRPESRNNGTIHRNESLTKMNHHFQMFQTIIFQTIIFRFNINILTKNDGLEHVTETFSPRTILDIYLFLGRFSFFFGVSFGQLSDRWLTS